jgi:alpha-glucosidase
VLRFWLDRGADGFRVDAVDRLLKDPELRDDPPAIEPFALPLVGEHGTLEHRYSRAAADVGEALGKLRQAVTGAPLVGEVYLPFHRLGPYLEHLDAAFSFELLHAPWDADAVRAAVEAALAATARRGRPAWVLSNHDFTRLATRVGPERVRAAALLLLTLPGMAFVYQGDEIGQGDGPGGDPPHDRAGRDAYRHPMQWDRSPGGGFTTGTPWLPVVDPAVRNVADQREDADSVLALYRDLIAARRRLGLALAFVPSDPGVLAFTRGDHLVAINMTDDVRPAPEATQVVRATHASEIPDGSAAPRELAPGRAFLARRAS